MSTSSDVLPPVRRSTLTVAARRILGDRVACFVGFFQIEGDTSVRHRVVSIFLGLVLLTAGILKSYQVVAETSVMLDLWQWFLFAVIEIEFILGGWLLSGFRLILAWRMALICFAIFGGVAFYQALAGETSCNCFGKLHLNPWYALSIDLGAIGILLLWSPVLNPSERSIGSSAYHGLLCGLPIIAVAIYFLGRIILLDTPATLALEDGRIIGQSRIVLLKPDEWKGRRFPLLQHIDIGSQLASGQWIVVFYHNNCPRCREIVSDYQQKALRQQSSVFQQPHIALIEVPTDNSGPQSESLFPLSKNCSTGRLSRSYKWFISTPTIIRLNAGMVQAVVPDSGIDSSEGDH